MFELRDFYTHCRSAGVDVIPYLGAPAAGTTIRDGEYYAIFLDFTKIPSLTKLKSVCLHELGHAATGALHKVSSPYETVERSEYRAHRWAWEHYVTEDQFREAFAEGLTETWQLSDYFGLPEEDIQKALHFWTDRRGVVF